MQRDEPRVDVAERAVDAPVGVIARDYVEEAVELFALRHDQRICRHGADWGAALSGNAISARAVRFYDGRDSRLSAFVVAEL